MGDFNFGKFPGSEREEPATDDVYPPKYRAVYRTLAFFFGMTGAHNFYAGRVGVAAAQAILTALGTATIFAIGAIGFVPLVFVAVWAIGERKGQLTDGWGRPLVE